MSRGLSRAERLREMEALYLQRAFSDAEMADRLGVDRTTVFKDRTRLLSNECPIAQDAEGRYKIDRTRYLSNVRVNLQEALVLYLAMRRASRQTRFAAPHVIRALEKVALTLRQPMTEQLVKAANTILTQPTSPERTAVTEAVVRGWAEQRKVRLVYQGLQAKQPWNFLVSPYLIEPAAWSDGAYIIGHSDVHGEVAVFKIERILEATLTLQTFTIPESFDEAKLLDYAWGIWRGENEPQTVRLRFQPGEAARRVKETIWHRLESVTDMPDGGCVWSAPIGEWHEMLPWIRGWGSQVEVLEPDALRAEIIQQVRDLAGQYKVIPSEVKAYSYLWAKADKKDSGKVHRLVYHLIDVGQTALSMWNRAIDETTKKQFCEWFKCDEKTTGRTLAFLVSLHDLGKASPTFQIKYQPICSEISKAGFWLPTSKPPQSSPHGVVSTWALTALLPEMLKISKPDAKMIAKALGGHHGSWPTPNQMMSGALTLTDKGNDDPSWDTARQELVQAMMEVFNPALEFSLPQDQAELNVMLTLFSGFTSVADWIGSMTEYFPYEKRTNLPLNEYATRSAQAAETALDQLGWFGWQADGNALTFKEMFPFITKMNSVQERIVGEVGKISQPALLILESPTGSGKTEAALYAADTWLQAQRGHGMYIAMPTQATSNQMYDRVTDFLLKRYPAKTLNVQLVHGGALLEDKKPIETQAVYDDDQNNTEGGIRAETWFLPRKRTLLAPFGVGTVDQALMCVLQTRHFFVRMFGLQNKVVVFDEVHAYDTYMSELFKQLLRWLRKIGASVILLSATLPEKTRRELTAAYLGEKEVDLPPTEYPRLTIASQEGFQSISLESPSERTVQLEWSDVDPKIIVEKLKEALLNGGCAAVICNRVQRAQEVFNGIKLAGLVPEEDLILFHARYPFQWRKEIEDKVLGKFGKGKDGGKSPNRPKKSIVVATQVIEQSLDLDFDYMISDLAPIDLLIQRAGRLHRHSQNDSSRPENLKNPGLQIVSPQANEIPDFGYDEYVYDRSIMLKTWLALKGQVEMNLPGQTTCLIEKVYGDDFEISDETLRKEMEEAIEKAEEKEWNAISIAARQLIDRPGEPDLLIQQNSNLNEEDSKVNAALRAMTRLAEPSISLICLHRVNGNLYFDPANTEEPLDASRRPDKDLIRELLKHSVNLQHYKVIEHFSESKPELDWKEWKEIAALKYSIPIVFENGRCKLEGAKYTLVLDRQTGLEIQKEGQ